jgi:hypothetical protein
VPSDSDSNPDSDEISRSRKVIVLREHQVAERILDQLLSTDPGSADFNVFLARSALLGPPMLAAIARRLDAFQPHVLDVLGRVVAIYTDSREATHNLKRIAADRRNTDRRRMGAVMVLEQALGVQPPDDFLATLREPVRSATGLLVGALDSTADNPTAMHDYLRALVFQPLDLLYSVLGTLAESHDDRTVDVLRLLAFQPDPGLQLGVIEALTETGSERAIHALLLLEPTLPDEPARAIGRVLQKLRLSGVSIEPLQRAGVGCRAWLSAIEGRGDRIAWLLAPGKDGEPTLLGMLLNDVSGVLDALGTSSIESSSLPPDGPPGVLYEELPFRIGDQLVADALGEPCGGYLEVRYDYALTLVQETVQLNWTTGAPLPVEYQLLNGTFWEYAGNIGAGRTGLLLDAEVEEETAQETESDLLFNPLFDSWYLDSPSVEGVAHEVASLDSSPPHEIADENWRILLPALIRLAHDEFGPHLRLRYAARLRRMAEWLFMSGNLRDAELAAQCARTMLNSPPEANLFVLRLVQKGILVALSRLTTANRTHFHV